jgi:type I restriction enzyme S subunit
MSKEPIRFKQTEIGELPEGWEVKPLSDVLLDSQSGEWGKDMKEFNPDLHEPVRIIRSTEFTKDCRLLLGTAAERAIPKKKAAKILLQEGDILVERSGGGPTQPVGRVIFVEKLPEGNWGFGNFIQRLRVKPEYHPRYIWAVLFWHWLKGSVLAMQEQTTGIRNLRWSDYLNLPIPLPPLEEQKRIAGVLRLVDRVAEETRRIVSIYERAKRFALKRLLTRGIGHTRFKQTEMGELPEGWEVKPLREVLSLSQGGIWGDEPDNSVDVFPVLRSTEIDHEGNLHLDSPTMAWRKVPRQKAERYALKDGDILVVKSSGSAHLLGRVALFHQQGEQIFLFSNFLHRLRANDEICNSIFLYYVLISPIAKQTLKQIQETTSGLRNLPMDEYLQMPIPLPPLEEQKQIVEMLSTIDAAIENERRYLRVLEKCKRWLLDNLLTGKIRLSPEVDEILKGVLPDAF